MRAAALISRLTDLMDRLDEARGLVQKAYDICDDMDQTRICDLADQSADAAEFCTDTDASLTESKKELDLLISEIESNRGYLMRHAREEDL